MGDGMSNYDKLVKRMESADKSAGLFWSKRYKVENRWEKAKEALQKSGDWERFCNAKGWAESANFMDCGA